MSKKKPKKPVRGSSISVTIPTEPMAGAAKTEPIMAVLVQDEGVQILEYEIKEGQSIEFRVGGTIKAFMERVGPVLDGDMFMDAGTANVERVTVAWQDALVGPQTKTLGPGQRLTVTPARSPAAGMMTSRFIPPYSIRAGR